jgi:riboflavin-specific deaminase-like protein
MNMAMSADGKIATANRRVSSFGSARDQAHLYALRATADAILCGARTVDLNDVTLGPGAARFRRSRLRRGLAEYPLRLVASGSGTLDARARLFASSHSPLIVLTTERISARRKRRLESVADAVRVAGAEVIDWHETLAWLLRDWGVRRLLCEGGGQLNDALFRAGLVDELHLTICPLVFGGRRAPTIADGLGADTLDATAPFALQSMRRVGEELFVVYRRADG